MRPPQRRVRSGCRRGEFKLYGTAVEVDDEERRNARQDAWWTSRPPEVARVFSLNIEEAASVAWAIERGEMTVTRWSLTRGVVETTRSYP